MNDRQKYAVAAIAMDIYKDQKFYFRPMSSSEIALHLCHQPIAAYVTEEDVALFLDYASSSGIAELVKTPYASPRFALNPMAVFEQSVARAEDTPLSMWQKLGDEWLLESLDNLIRLSPPKSRLLSEVPDNEYPSYTLNVATDTPKPTIAPAADRYVPLDHNSRLYKEMTVTLDDAIRAMEGLNEELDAETSAKVVELAAGRKLLEATSVDFRFVEDLIIKGLRHVAGKAINNTIDTLTKAALAAVLLYFGLA